ncbi:MAG: hypothetical protein U1F33_11670 [Alphaproteobacteria bacterium]
MIDRSSVKRLLAIHGANRARWPTDARPAAERTRTTSEDSARSWQEAEQLDQWLDRFAPRLSDARLLRVRRAIFASLDEMPAPGSSADEFVLPGLRHATIFVSIAVVGFAIGFFIMNGPPGAPSATDIVQLLSSIE